MAFFRRSAAQVLLTFVSVISFLGTGLHLLPGCNHFHDLGLSSDYTPTARTSMPVITTTDDCDDDCPICRFIAIPWALTAPPAIVDCGVHFEPRRCGSNFFTGIVVARPYGARAPPQPPLSGRPFSTSILNAARIARAAYSIDVTSQSHL